MSGERGRRERKVAQDTSECRLNGYPNLVVRGNGDQDARQSQLRCLDIVDKEAASIVGDPSSEQQRSSQYDRKHGGHVGWREGGSRRAVTPFLSPHVFLRCGIETLSFRRNGTVPTLPEQSDVGNAKKEMAQVYHFVCATCTLLRLYRIGSRVVQLSRAVLLSNLVSPETKMPSP